MLVIGGLTVESRCDCVALLADQQSLSATIAGIPTATSAPMRRGSSDSTSECFASGPIVPEADSAVGDSVNGDGVSGPL